jgi:hypothetical protein
MATEGYKKKDIQRAVKPTNVALSSVDLDADTTTDRVEMGFAAEKITVVTTGTLTANVTPKLGDAAANSAIAASTTASTTTTSNMFASVEIVRTGGAGKVIILAR